MLPSELLAKGWIQGHSVNVARTRFCIMGAISRLDALCRNPLQVAITKQIEATGWICPLDRMPISTWNDEKTRTQAEVVALVLRAEIACGLRPDDDPEQWEIPAAQPVETEPVLVESK